MNMKQYSLSDLGLKVHSGQIMSRITLKDSKEVNEVIQMKVIIPKCINADGTINTVELPSEQLRAMPEQNRITKEGDIVIKLSTPYDAAIITKESAGCIVPSFCAIIKDCGDLDKYYLLAFLNSELCKKQLRDSVAGTIMTILSIGKIAAVEVPVPDRVLQEQIGKDYMDVQYKLQTIKRIAELSVKRNDVVFKELVRDNG